jgi:hypothetical protein
LEKEPVEVGDLRRITGTPLEESREYTNIPEDDWIENY